MQLGSQVFLVEFIARPNRGPVHITRSRSVPTLRREKERDIYISKKRRNDVSRLFLLLFLSTLLLPSRAHTYAGRKHCFHSFINLAEGNIYRRIHGCIHSRPRFMRPYPFCIRAALKLISARPMGRASTATGKINTRPLSLPVFFNQGNVVVRGNAWKSTFRTFSWLIGESIRWCWNEQF